MTLNSKYYSIGTFFIITSSRVRLDISLTIIINELVVKFVEVVIVIIFNCFLNLYVSDLVSKVEVFQVIIILSIECSLYFSSYKSFSLE